MKNITLLLTEGTSIDTNTGQWSLFNHLESLLVKRPESETISVRGKFTVVSFWAVDKNDENKFFEVKHQIVNSQGEEMIKHEGVDIEIGEDVNIFKQRIKVQKIPLKGEGLYFLESFIREKGDKEYRKMAQTPLRVKWKEE